MDLRERVERRDIGVFEHIPSQTTDDDRRALLGIHAAIAARGPFSYLEIGSHLGGTLQGFVADPRCTRIVSIDPRPQIFADAEMGINEYPDNSTARMLEHLEAVPAADLGKIQTVEASTEDLPPGDFARPDLCFIDGEHTYDAALRDARWCKSVVQGAGILVFHDRMRVEAAIEDFLAETPGRVRAYPLLSYMFVVELGSVPSVLPSMRSMVAPPMARVWPRVNRLRRSGPLVATLRASRELRARRPE